MANRSHTDKTSAEDKSIGFDYQFYFFLLKVLELKSGQSVGLEVKDDVHTELSNDVQIFYQVKHTVKTKSDNSPSNLTTSDVDFWKTLSNWSKVISDSVEGRSGNRERLEFISKSSFVLYSNKSYSSDNKATKAIEKFKTTSNGFEVIEKFLNDFKKETGNDTLKAYVDDVLSLDSVVLSAFLNNIHFELDENDVIEKCKGAIKAKMIPEDKVEEVFSSVFSKLREDIFDDVKSGNKIQISFEEFHTKYGLLFNVTRDGSISIRDYEIELPDALEEQVFIKQLLEIGDISIDDVEIMAEYTRFKLKLITHLNDWYSHGDITKEELMELDKEAVASWKNRFRRTFRDGVFTDAKSQDLVDDLREIIFSVAGQDLGTELSNGQLYKLSDKPQIGWKDDWEKYKEL